MLYFKALREGLNDLPSADSAVRKQLEVRAETVGWPAMHQELAKIDPATADRFQAHLSAKCPYLREKN